MKSGISANQLWTQVPVASRTVSLGAGAAGTIKSIQRGTCSVTGTEQTNDATLSPAVVMANTEVRNLGVVNTSTFSGLGYKWMAYFLLQSTTAVRMRRPDAANIGLLTVEGSWEITEWY